MRLRSNRDTEEPKPRVTPAASSRRGARATHRAGDAISGREPPGSSGSSGSSVRAPVTARAKRTAGSSGAVGEPEKKRKKVKQLAREEVPCTSKSTPPESVTIRPEVDVEGHSSIKGGRGHSLTPSPHLEGECPEVKRSRRRGRYEYFVNDNGTKNIEDIPQHILVSVFTMLPIVDRIKAERVCRRWRYLSREFAWRNTRTFSFSTLMKYGYNNNNNNNNSNNNSDIYNNNIDNGNNNNVNNNNNNNNNGSSLSSSLWNSNNSGSVGTASLLTRSLQRFTGERPFIGDAEVKSLAQRCGKYVRTIDLHAFRDTLTYGVCRSLAGLCPNITNLNLCGIQLTNSSVQLLGRHCVNLEDVNFNRCFQESVVERGLSSFFSKCVHLRSVDVGENERLSGVPSFETLPTGLLTLKVGGCYRLTSAAMNSVKTRCPNLTYLMMNNVDTLSAHELNNFFAAMGNLRRLKFGECFISHTIGGADLNLGALKNLTELTINDNLLITDRVLRTLVNGCKKLRYVDVSGCNRFVTNDGLMELAKLQNLTHLNLSLMRITSDETVKLLAERGVLQAIFLHRCDEITDAAVAKLLECCPNLTSLDVSFCPLITNASMNAIYLYVLQREMTEKLNPEALLSAARHRRDDEHLTQLLRYERSVHALMDAADLDGADDLLSFDNVYYRIEPGEALRAQPAAVGAQAGVFEAARARAAFFEEVGARAGALERAAGAGQQQQQQQRAAEGEVQAAAGDEGEVRAGRDRRSRSASKPPEDGGGGDRPMDGLNAPGGSAQGSRGGTSGSGEGAKNDGGKNKGEGGSSGTGPTPGIPFTKLRVWVGNSGVTNCNERRHPLLIVDNGEAEFGDYPASVFEFRVVITINN